MSPSAIHNNLYYIIFTTILAQYRSCLFLSYMIINTSELQPANKYDSKYDLCGGQIITFAQK